MTPQDAPSRPKLAPTWPQDSPKLAPNWHQNPPQNRLLRRSPLQRPICQRFWPNVGAFGGSICGHFGASLEGFSSLVFVLVTFLPVQDRLAPPREMPTICSSSSWLRRAAAIAKRLGSAARHSVAALRRFESPLAWSRLGPKWTAGAAGTAGPISREPKVPLWAPKKRRRAHTVIYSILAPNVAKTQRLSGAPLVPPTRVGTVRDHRCDRRTPARTRSSGCAVAPRRRT